MKPIFAMMKIACSDSVQQNLSVYSSTHSFVSDALHRREGCTILAGKLNPKAILKIARFCQQRMQ